MTKKVNEYIGYPIEELEKYKAECKRNIDTYKKCLDEEKKKLVKIEEAITVTLNSTSVRIAEIKKGYTLQDMGDGCHSYGQKVKVFHFELSIYNIINNTTLNKPIKQKIYTVKLPNAPREEKLWQMIMTMRENNVTSLYVSKESEEFVNKFKLMLYGIEIKEL